MVTSELERAPRLILLDVYSATGKIAIRSSTGTNTSYLTFNNTGGNGYIGLGNSAAGNALMGTGGLAYNLGSTVGPQQSYGIQLGTGASNLPRITIDGV